MGHRNTVQKCLALALSAIVPIAVMANDWGGTVTAASGVVKLNGQLIRGTHTILPGDTLRTGAGNAMVRLANGSVAVSGNSDARFDNDLVVLQGGFAEISGTKAVETVYRDLAIRAVGNEEATFVVGELDGTPTVATLKGAIVVSNASGSVVLPAGRAMEAGPEDEEPTPVAAVQEGQAAEPAVKGGHGPKGDQQRGGKRNRRMLAGWWEAAILAGAIGGTLGILALLGVFDRGPISPSQPVNGGRGSGH